MWYFYMLSSGTIGTDFIKTSNILKTNTFSKEHSYLFPDNLNAFKVNKNNNIQLKKYDYSQFGNTFQEKCLLYRNLSIDLQSAIIDWFLY